MFCLVLVVVYDDGDSLCVVYFFLVGYLDCCVELEYVVLVDNLEIRLLVYLFFLVGWFECEMVDLYGICLVGYFKFC